MTPAPHPALLRGSLTAFEPRRLAHRFADVLVLGSGVAGLAAALAAACEGRDVLVVGKSRLEESATRYAQGGIAAVLAPERTGDSVERHAKDTIEAACGLADEAIVRLTVTEGVERVRELIRMGARFDRDASGELAFTREGGHSRPRILHRGDTTGLELERALLEAALKDPRIQCLEHTFAVDLLGDETSVRGALVHRAGNLEIVWARRTILATGGAGRLYRETTNPAVCTGDGIAMAFRRGAVLQDLEFVQFHPTTLYVAGAERFLITEAVRGEGGVLRDSRGEAFMKRFHPLADLAPRDVVSRAILTVMKETGDNKVWLDLSGIPLERIERRFPNILKICRGFGIDIRKEPIPVRPSAHYSIGGVRTDSEGRTSIEGLFAAGEVASTGLHGANRLASNSLLEGLVFGHRAGKAAAREAGNVPMPDPFAEAGSPAPPAKERIPAEVNQEDLATSLRSLMWYRVGVERRGEDLRDALEQIERWASYALRADFSDPQGWTLQNMLQTGWLIAYAALKREESRGVHYRTDFPGPDDRAWKRHLTLSRADF